MVETKTPAAASLPLSPEGQSMYSDVYKDVYGMRPRLSRAQWDSLTHADFDALLVLLEESIKQDWERDHSVLGQFVDTLRVHMGYVGSFGSAIRSVFGITNDMTDGEREYCIESWFYENYDYLPRRIQFKLVKWSHL